MLIGYINSKVKKCPKLRAKRYSQRTRKCRYYRRNSGNSLSPRTDTSKSLVENRASVVLDKIKGTAWMGEEEIVLLGREHKHRQVLEKYIKAEDILKAEMHCERHLDEPDLMNEFFELLIEHYETLQERLK